MGLSPDEIRDSHGDLPQIFPDFKNVPWQRRRQTTDKIMRVTGDVRQLRHCGEGSGPLNAPARRGGERALVPVDTLGHRDGS